MICIPVGLLAEVEGRARFIPNQGQWPGDFEFFMPLNRGAVYFENDGYTILLKEQDDHEHHHHHPAPKAGHVLKVHFENASPESIPQGKATASYYHNYLRGPDPALWQQKVPVYHELSYQNIYPGIDLRFAGRGQNLKYDILLKAGNSPSQIQMSYRGAESLFLRQGRLHIKTSVGTLMETLPETYQIIDGVKVLRSCRYTLKGNKVGFVVEDYDPAYDLIIDPEIIFSSFSGSSADNWGFTATYDSQGALYGGGIVFNDGGNYPVTPGAFKAGFGSSNPDIDIAISKFSADGSQLLYSTQLGGSDVDIPHSLVVDEQDNLYILGNSGSQDYPVLFTAYQINFMGGPALNASGYFMAQGSDIIISKLNQDGSGLLGSTFLGGSDNDGANVNVYRNYGDNSRGEIIYHNNRVYIISNTLSDTIALQNSFYPYSAGMQDALIASFNPDLSVMHWGNFLGGSVNEGGYSLKINLQQELIAAGGSSSNDFPLALNAAHGQLDGFIARLDAGNGQLLNSRYLGTNGNDQIFLVDIDRTNQIYSFGQTDGNIPISSGLYANPNSRQFLAKLSADLNALQWTTQIGSGENKSDLVPTAFMVDDCYNIYLSGWNGSSNRLNPGGIPLGNTNNLPLSSDAYQTNTDGSDFYFMILGRNASHLKYATYFGGNSAEHVDGGTSRFDASGTIYQAVCAGCAQLSFPTTPGVVSTVNNSNNCNLGVIKLDLNVDVEAEAEIDYGRDVDTLCDSLRVTFSNYSSNAQIYQWDFGNGQTSNDSTPTVVFQNFGSYTIRLIATDTNCAISDTTYLNLLHDSGAVPKARFTSQYVGCDTSYEVSLQNQSAGAQQFSWNMGDGNVLNSFQPLYRYQDSGTYIITLTALDTICNNFSTFSDTVTFADTTSLPTVRIYVSECSDGSLNIELNDRRERYRYLWDFGDGNSSTAPMPNHRYREPGAYIIQLQIIDTVCQKISKREIPLDIDEIGVEVFIPNAFTPNNDGRNEQLTVFGNLCDSEAHFIIFNRWGEVVFETEQPFTLFWDGEIEGRTAPQGVYPYKLKTPHKTYQGTITLFR